MFVRMTILCIALYIHTVNTVYGKGHYKNKDWYQWWCGKCSSLFWMTSDTWGPRHSHSQFIYVFVHFLANKHIMNKIIRKSHNSALGCLNINYIMVGIVVAMFISKMHEKSCIDLHSAWKFEKKSYKIQSFTYLTMEMMKLENRFTTDFLSYLNHTTLSSKKFTLTNLSRIRIWNMINLI